MPANQAVSDVTSKPPATSRRGIILQWLGSILISLLLLLVPIADWPWKWKVVLIVAVAAAIVLVWTIPIIAREIGKFLKKSLGLEGIDQSLQSLISAVEVLTSRIEGVSAATVSFRGLRQARPERAEISNPETSTERTMVKHTKQIYEEEGKSGEKIRRETETTTYQ